ncbi:MULTISPECIES: hypothetical protein [Methylomonas]|uniref:hypothetical protein n=1 Tax=Methylomonas TaxID=416 RepID=UPI000A735C4B|nr:hypothetical protein [Methylomonas koyamae]
MIISPESVVPTSVTEETTGGLDLAFCKAFSCLSNNQLVVNYRNAKPDFQILPSVKNHRTATEHNESQPKHAKFTQEIPVILPKMPDQIHGVDNNWQILS